MEQRAADGVHLKLVKAGGIRALMAMVRVAEEAGLPYLVGQMDEGTLATAAGLACAAAASPMSCELWGFQRVGSQPFSPLTMQDGRVVLPTGPGLGIDVDEAALTQVARFEAASSARSILSGWSMPTRPATSAAAAASIRRARAPIRPTKC